MPVHDWTRVDAGLFHDFHQSWTVTLRNALNAGVLPSDYFALVEQNVRGPIADVLTLKLAPGPEAPSNGISGLAVATRLPPARLVRRNEADKYAARANRITVRHRHGDVVAVIEIISPGNKGSRSEFRAFVDKSVSLIRQGFICSWSTCFHQASVIRRDCIRRSGMNFRKKSLTCRQTDR
jgi:hypothetical protein